MSSVSTEPGETGGSGSAERANAKKKKNRKSSTTPKASKVPKTLARSVERKRMCMRWKR
jgi:hypothetical protein